MQDNTPKTSFCEIPLEPDYSKLKQIELSPEGGVKDFQQAKELADKIADTELDEHMLLSFYDKDNDYESPRNASDCHENSPIPGYVDYALYRDASLRVNIGQGRFVFFYLGL